MRVVHVITRMIVGGAQENTLYNCLDLKRHYSDEVLLITGPSLGPEGDLISREKEVLESLCVEIVMSLCRRISPWRDFQAYLAIRRLMKNFNPDVVHTHSAKAGILGRAAAWSLGVPVVVHSVHGAPFHQYQSRISSNVYRMAERWAARRCHRMISVANAMTDLMVGAGVAERAKFKTIYSGMSVEPFLNSTKFRNAIRKKYGIEDHQVVIGKIARLFHLKGHKDVIEAARGVIAKQPDVRFLFVGDGVLKETLISQLERLGLSKYFIFTGLVNPSEVPQLIGAMDLLVHASYREGLARALPQALLSGIPVISYDVDGAREVVLDEVTGRLVAAGDIRGLSEAMEMLVGNPGVRQKYGSEGQRRFTQQFRHEEMTRHIRQLYVDLLNQNISRTDSAQR
ncbi:glycosyltransferase family 4 protein [Rubripirellula sp.]|nr:glycosyltransferase family 4 protein [Rubripirellula sp.]